MSLLQFPKNEKFYFPFLNAKHWEEIRNLIKTRYLLLLFTPDELTTFTMDAPDECGGFDGDREWI